MEQDRDSAQWRQFFRLGEMIGDGLHNEPDGRWISKEYRSLQKILIPQTKEELDAKREWLKTKNEKIDAQMAKLLENKKCDCGGIIKQKRSGTKVAYCKDCNTRYRAK
jgi:hypothetical protein